MPDCKTKCVNCLHFAKIADDVPKWFAPEFQGQCMGCCHACPPMCSENGSGRWPLVLSDDFCGKWTPKPDPQE